MIFSLGVQTNKVMKEVHSVHVLCYMLKASHCPCTCTCMCYVVYKELK